MKKKLLFLSVLALSTGFLGACGNSNGGSVGDGLCETVSPVYRVYFYTNGGSEVETKEVAAGGTLNKPSDPVKAMYTFEGWYTNSKGTGAQFDFSTPISSNMVLYAKWSAMSSEAVEAYNNSWLEKSEKDHLYIHYLRFNNTPEEYEDWDIWSWPYGRDGTNFDFVKQDGTIVTDDLGGAYVDIDLTKTYSPAGWLEGDYVSGLSMSYMQDGELTPKVGFQIVKKATRSNVDSYWENDGDDNFVTLSEAKWENGSYHVFCVQNTVPRYTTKYTAEKAEDPYENDDGNNVSQANVNSSQSSYGVTASSQDFYNNAGIGYQVMLASFADSDGDGMGDIYGVTKKLNYLKENLNVDTLWLTPVQLSDSYHAYDIIDYKVVDPKFGSKNSPNTQNGIPTEESAMKDYEDLLSEAQKLDIRVVMDLVVNHTSKKNVWFLESSQLNPDYRSFYQWKKSSEVSSNKNWHQYSTTAYSYYGKFASSMPELNYDYQGTRDAMVDVAEFWIDKGVDGFRIDAVKHIYMEDEVNKASTDQILKDYDAATATDYSSNLTKNVNFFKEFNARIKEKNPNVMILGENFDGNAVNNVAPYYQGLDSMFDFYMYYKLSNIAMSNSSNSGARAQSIANLTGDWCFPGVFNKYNSYRTNAIESVFTSNHDVPRMMNMMAGTVINADDQNAGTITSSNAASTIEKAKCYSTVMTMLPGITWIYYGDELGMSSNFGAGEDKGSPHADRWYRQPYKFGNEASGVADSDGVYQTGFNFTGGAGFAIGYDNYNGTQLKSAKDQLQDSNSMLSYYKKLTSLKSNSSALIKGTYTGINTGRETVFAFTRTDGTDTYHIYVNFGATSANVTLKPGTHVVTTGTVSSNSLGAHSAVIIKA